jgi:murein DD-endopeptidase
MTQRARQGSFVTGICTEGPRFCETPSMTTSCRKGLWRTGSASVLLSCAASIWLAMFLGGCAGALRWEGETPAAAVTMPTSSPRSAAADKRSRVASTATGMIGVPYRYGGESPSGFDCSGLVQYSYRAAGMKVPRTSRAQYKAATPIRLTEAVPGDLLFFRYDNKISHVAIYLGDERFVHAPSSGKQVSVASLRDPHYQQHFAQAGRL